ncbi:hypothetical protein GGR54DRAFT_357025 [Hypoxylon sp. NC1633]|nr:hypothetical protein GGR54DRAFT_357025 [Hypoxylon sp. NC1633]
MDSSSSLHDRAQDFLATLAAQCSVGQGRAFGSMSSSVYDTAWLSMVRRPTSVDFGIGVDRPWLFPECFEYVLSQQLPSGAWQSYTTCVDGILNTAAALLSLKRHLRTQPGHEDWLQRSQKAEEALRRLLNGWDIESTDQVGQEILVISLLHLLEKEGVYMNFPQLSALSKTRNAKLCNLTTARMYANPSTLYHSLEAFIGHIDFDNIRRWREANGSMMGSPASTAAYLMYSSTWDDEAEAYLRNVLHRGNGISGASVPCAWPTTIFEVSWVITTFATAGIPIAEAERSVFSNLLQGTLMAQDGLLGFAPGTFPDADDTAKGLESLHHLGQESSIDGLLRTFSELEHFITYPGERNPSFSANCNVVILLLVRDDRSQHFPGITKALEFLIGQAFGGHVKEKWHVSELYWMMLLSRVFELLFRDHDFALTIFNRRPNLRDKISMVSLHILMRLLHSQQKDGSWDGICEVTSYGVLALISLAKLPWVQQLDLGGIIDAVAHGKAFLLSKREEWSRGHHLWIEKVTYSSDVLSEAYSLAASLATMPSNGQGEPAVSSASRAFLVPNDLLFGMRKTGDLISHTPLFVDKEPGVLRIAEMQACFAIQMLQRQPPSIFPRTAKGKDKYMFIIPLALTVSAELHGCLVSLWVLYDMMELSILNFHADEYMEGVIEKHFGADLDAIRKVVRQLFVRDNPGIWNGVTEGLNEKKRSTRLQGQQPSIEDVRSVLHLFVTHILHHPAVLSSPAGLQSQLAFELETFLLAHITHAEDNHRLRQQPRLRGNGSLHTETNGVSKESLLQYRTPGRSFYHWVRSTSADHTSCPFSFIYFNCLLDSSLSYTGKMRRGGILASARTAYLAEDACRHLASLCRMYNDFGSLARDAEEGSLNSVNFPEFWLGGASTETKPTGDTAKRELLWIAEYERRGLDTAMKLLEEELGSGELMGALRVFVDVTDLYGQIYVLRDVGTRTK